LDKKFQLAYVPNRKLIGSRYIGSAGVKNSIENSN